MEYCINSKGNVGIECPRCHKVVFLPITEQELLAWDPQETHVQKQFPQLSPAQREMLLTGLCGDCWDEIFKEDEDIEE